MKSDGVIMPPTKAVLSVCDALDQAIDHYLAATEALTAGTYEADVEALLIFNLGVRHVDALIALGRQDLVLVPAAYSLARAAFECCVRAAWLVDEAEPMRREARWIAHLDGEISAIRRTIERLDAAGPQHTARRERERSNSLQDFRDDVAHALQRHGVGLLKQTPNFAAMLSSIGGDHLYTAYIEASQYTHGGHQATWLYRGEGLGTRKVIGERISAQQWVLPFRMRWLALGYPGDIVTSRIAGDHSVRWSAACAPLVDAAFQDLTRGRPELLH